MTLDTVFSEGRHQRRYKRKPITARVIVVADQRIYFSEAIEISEGGMLLSTSPRVQISAQIELKLFHPDGGVYCIQGEVIYFLDDPEDLSKPVRAGVKFKSPSQEAIEKIRAFVDQPVVNN